MQSRLFRQDKPAYSGSLELVPPAEQQTGWEEKPPPSGGAGATASGEEPQQPPPPAPEFIRRVDIPDSGAGAGAAAAAAAVAAASGGDGWEAQPEDLAVNQAGSINNIGTQISKMNALIEAGKVSVPPQWRKTRVTAKPSNIFELNLTPATEEQPITQNRHSNRVIVYLTQYAEHEPETYFPDLWQMILDHIAFNSSQQQGDQAAAAGANVPPLFSLRIVKMGTKYSQLVLTFSDIMVASQLCASLQQVGLTTAFAEPQLPTPSTTLMFVDVRKTLNNGNGLEAVDLEKLGQPSDSIASKNPAFQDIVVSTDGGVVATDNTKQTASVIPALEDGIFYVVFPDADDIYSLLVGPHTQQQGGKIQQDMLKNFGVFFCVAECEEDLVDAKKNEQLAADPYSHHQQQHYQQATDVFDSFGGDQQPNVPPDAQQAQQAAVPAATEEDMELYDFMMATGGTDGASGTAGATLGLGEDMLEFDEVTGEIIDKSEVKAKKEREEREKQEREAAAAAAAAMKAGTVTGPSKEVQFKVGDIAAEKAHVESAEGVWEMNFGSGGTDGAASGFGPTGAGGFSAPGPTLPFGTTSQGLLGDTPEALFAAPGGMGVPLLQQPGGAFGQSDMPPQQLGLLQSNQQHNKYPAAAEFDFGGGLPRPISPEPTFGAEEFTRDTENTVIPEQILHHLNANRMMFDELNGPLRDRIAAVVVRDECFRMFLNTPMGLGIITQLMWSPVMIKGITDNLFKCNQFLREERVTQVLANIIQNLPADSCMPIIEKLFSKHDGLVKAVTKDNLARRCLLVLMKAVRSSAAKAIIAMDAVQSFVEESVCSDRDIDVIDFLLRNGVAHPNDVLSPLAKPTERNYKIGKNRNVVYKQALKATRNATSAHPWLNSYDPVAAAATTNNDDTTNTTKKDEDMCAMANPFPALSERGGRFDICKRLIVGLNAFVTGRRGELHTDDFRNVFEPLPAYLLAMIRDLDGKAVRGPDESKIVSIPARHAVNALAGRMAGVKDAKFMENTVGGAKPSQQPQQQTGGIRTNIPTKPEKSAFTPNDNNKQDARGNATADNKNNAGSKRKRGSFYDELMDEGLLDFDGYHYNNNLGGVPFPQLPKQFSWKVSHSSGFYYFVDRNGSGSSKQTFRHPLNGKEYRATPQQFVREHKRTYGDQRQWLLNVVKRAPTRVIEDWLSNQRLRDEEIDVAVIDALRITYRHAKKETDSGASGTGQQKAAAAASVVAAEPVGPPAWEGIMKAYPAVGYPFPDSKEGQEPLRPHLSSSHGLYYFDSKDKETGAMTFVYKHPETGKEYLPSPQAFFTAKLGKDINKAVEFFCKRHPDVSPEAVKEWHADQRRRDAKIDPLVLKDLKIQYPKLAAPASSAAGTERDSGDNLPRQKGRQ